MHRLNNTRIGLLLFATLLLSGAAPQDEQRRIHGFWTPPDGGRIEITTCGGSLCAFIREEEADSGKDSLDGYRLFENFVYAGGGRWREGTIYNPRNNKSYKSKLHLLSNGRLRVKGCLWLFCGGQTWKRIE